MLDEERNHFVNGALQQGYPQKQLTKCTIILSALLIMALTARMHCLFLYWFSNGLLEGSLSKCFYVALLHSVRHNPTKIKEYIGEARKTSRRFCSRQLTKVTTAFT